MQYRRLGKSDLNLSTIGLGTWAIGGGAWKFGWGDQNETDAVKAIVRAVELGVNWIDTAAVYGEGRSEELVAEALKRIPVSQRPIIATKCGRVPTATHDIVGCLKRESVMKECEASLRRLKVDSIDLYQLHWPDPDADIEEAWQALADLRKQGKVRYIGVSNHSVAQLQRLMAIEHVTSVQPPYSMIAREVEDEILPWCISQQTGVICYSPMGKGLLTGTFNAERVASLAPTDHRSRDPRFLAPQLDVNLRFVAQLDRIAHDLSWSTPELALAWVLRRPEVTSAIVGARSALQIEETAKAGSRTLPDDASVSIQSFIQERELRLQELGAIVRARV
ncbi:MAG: aldo/keto reductase [Planctomyces sp.]